MPITVESGLALTYLTDGADTITGEIQDQAGHYVVSLRTALSRLDTLIESLRKGSIVTIEKTDEGIETLWHIIKHERLCSWIEKKRLRFITSSDSDVTIANLNSEYFLGATIGSQAPNLTIQYQTCRPFKFLFTNRKLRPHRKYLITRLRDLDLLESALWSCLDERDTWGHPDLTRVYASGQGCSRRMLDQCYESTRPLEWADGVIQDLQFAHTWFSLVSETGFEYPYSYRTEKIWKPILAAHPFLVSANQGFLRDLRKLGFRTFSSLVDTSFDQESDGQRRLDRLIDTLVWLCRQDLEKFWEETRQDCLYNQARAHELHNSQFRDFTQQFTDFVYA